MDKINISFSGRKEAYYFFGAVNIWFDFTDEGVMGFFNFISDLDVYIPLRQICIKHGSGERIKFFENGERIYGFKIPSESSTACYEEIKSHSLIFDTSLTPFEVT